MHSFQILISLMSCEISKEHYRHCLNKLGVFTINYYKKHNATIKVNLWSTVTFCF